MKALVPLFLLAAGLPGQSEPAASPRFDPLPLTSVKPRGWLLRQLKIQAAGLTGHIDEFWPDLSSNSGWLGGTGESWERGPYYLDGLVPLAYLLDDPVLIAKARKWVNWTLEHQRPDGSIGPEKNRDWWPNMVMLKVLTQYQEASGDPRVMPAMGKYFEYQAKTLAENPMQKWAVYRWGDEVLSIVWLYRHNRDPKLLDLARALAHRGYDWKQQFANFTYTGKMAKKDTNLKTHVVNNAMALKTAAAYSLISNDESDRQAIYQMLTELDRYHLLPNGVHSGDEHYAGLDPSQGTELCAVVENMFSLENLISILGDPAFGDRLEKIAFNPLPAAITSDMWAHQYDQQPNQVLADI
ncbi:MAG: glycoside hydrolase family 127 protein, partial [Acidobacteriota bacterium]|nr:glycoside hydrolase family 127 protein [Acidobacteriota bacterium]